MWHSWLCSRSVLARASSQDKNGHIWFLLGQQLSEPQKKQNPRPISVIFSSPAWGAHQSEKKLKPQVMMQAIFWRAFWKGGTIIFTYSDDFYLPWRILGGENREMKYSSSQKTVSESSTQPLLAFLNTEIKNSSSIFNFFDCLHLWGHMISSSFPKLFQPQNKLLISFKSSPPKKKSFWIDFIFLVYGTAQLSFIARRQELYKR